MNVILGLRHFFEEFFKCMYSASFGIVTLLAYLVGYPARVTILTLVLVFFVLDILTRFYAIRQQNGGFIKAFLNGKLNSRSFINGFVTKIIAYFVILVCANFAIITPEISFIGTAIATVLYTGLFFYELYSNLENLRDAKYGGATPLIEKVKQIQDKFMSGDNIENIKEQIVDAVKEGAQNNQTVTGSETDAKG
jgi:phage-related holin